MEEIKTGYMQIVSINCTKCQNGFKPDRFPMTAEDLICPQCKMHTANCLENRSFRPPGDFWGGTCSCIPKLTPEIADDPQINTLLATELTKYAELKLWTMQKYVGQWVVIHGEKYEVWHCYEDALKYGYMTYGLKPFLCKKIVDPADRRNMVWL